MIFLYSYSEIAFSVMSFILEKDLGLTIEKFIEILEIEINETILQNIDKIKKLLLDPSLYEVIDEKRVGRYLKEVNKFMKSNEEYQKSYNDKKKYYNKIIL